MPCPFYRTCPLDPYRGQTCLALFDPANPQEAARALEERIQEYLGGCGVEVLTVEAGQLTKEAKMAWGRLKRDENGQFVTDFDDLTKRVLVKLYNTENRRQFILLEMNVIEPDFSISVEIPKLLWTFEPKFDAISEAWPDALETVIEEILGFSDGGDLIPVDYRRFLDESGMTTQSLQLSRIFQRCKGEIIENGDFTHTSFVIKDQPERPDGSGWELLENKTASFVEKVQDLDHKEVDVLLTKLKNEAENVPYEWELTHESSFYRMTSFASSITSESGHGCSVTQCWIDEEPEYLAVAGKCYSLVVDPSEKSLMFLNTPERQEEFKSMISNIVDDELLLNFVRTADHGMKGILKEVVQKWNVRWKMSKEEIDEELDNSRTCVLS